MFQVLLLEIRLRFEAPETLLGMPVNFILLILAILSAEMGSFFGNILLLADYGRSTPCRFWKGVKTIIYTKLFLEASFRMQTVLLLTSLSEVSLWYVYQQSKLSAIIWFQAILERSPHPFFVGQQASLLKRMAERCKIPVVVTNQVTNFFSDFHPRVDALLRMLFSMTSLDFCSFKP